MISFQSLNDIVGREFFYDDKETGVGWNIQIYEIYREHSEAAVCLILTDYVKVKLSHIDLVRGWETIANKIHDTYTKSLE